jgi:hypothetical protein
MNKLGSKGHDVLALIGWCVAGMWGWTNVVNAHDLRDDPTMIRGAEKATLVSVSGGVLLAIGLALAVMALIRLFGDGHTIGSESASLALGLTLLALFAVFCAWGIPITKDRGIAAAVLLQIPYLITGVAVLLTRTRQSSRAPVDVPS